MTISAFITNNVSSFYHSTKQGFGLEPSPTSILLQEFNSFQLSDPKCEPLHKVVAYLANHSNSKLRKALENKFRQASPADVSKSLHSVVAYSLTSGQLKMLDVCQKVVSLPQLKDLAHVQDVLQLAQADALAVPKPQKTMDVISHSLKHRWFKHGIFNKVIQYFVQTISWTYSINLDRPPNSYWMAQSQWTFFRTFASDITWIGQTFLALFSTTWKAVSVGLGIFASLMGCKWIYNRFHLGVPESLDRDHFRNLTTEAKSGQLQPTEGRKDQLETLECCLSAPPGQKPRIPILVGPPGVGKTQIVEGLALKIANGEIPTLKDKKVFIVNMANLTEFGNYSEGGYSSRIDTLFQQIEGYEKDIILFFDEAQNAATQADGPESSVSSSPSLLEMLKTKLMESDVLCILATTEDEYQKQIATNKPFAERTRKIDFAPLDLESTRIILQKKARFGSDNVVKIDLSAIDAILKVAEIHPTYKDRANPRKAEQILQEAIGYVYSWKPKKLNQEIEKIELKHKKLLAQCLEHRKTPGWSLSAAGQKELNELQLCNHEWQALKEKADLVHTQFKKVSHLRNLEPVYSEREYEMIHWLAEKGMNEEASKTYLFLQFILLPEIRSQIQREAKKLHQDFGEKIPLQVDAEIIHQLFG